MGFGRERVAVTELEIPPDTDETTARELIEEFVDVGAEVDIQSAKTTDTTGGTPEDVHGTITGFEHGYLELDGDSPEHQSVRYDEIHLVTRIETKNG